MFSIFYEKCGSPSESNLIPSIVTLGGGTEKFICMFFMVNKPGFAPLLMLVFYTQV